MMKFLFLLLFFLNNAYAGISTIHPVGSPIPGEDSINEAMRIYKLTLPKEVEIYYLKNFSDRGSFSSLCLGGVIIIGDKAFKSWNLLASTISHEIFHSRQHNKNEFTIRDEVAAYQHEIEQQAYFRIDPLDIIIMSYWQQCYSDLKKCTNYQLAEINRDKINK